MHLFPEKTPDHQFEPKKNALFAAEGLQVPQRKKRIQIFVLGLVLYARIRTKQDDAETVF